MARAEAFRRAFHLVTPFWLTYYLLPPDLEIGVAREYTVIVFLIAILVIETVRLSMRLNIPGLRKYEAGRPAAYAVGGLGIGLGLLFFPMPITIVVVAGMAWVDPLCGVIKGKRWYPAVPISAYFALAVIVFIFLELELPIAIFLAAIGAIMAIAAEHPNLKLVDDDFVMTIVPLIVLGGLWLLLGLS